MFEHVSIEQKTSARFVVLGGRSTLIVPLVALVGDSVIHAVNATCPELVPLSVLQDAPRRWNGKPIVRNHPTRGGQQVSANDPAILTAQQVGTIANTRVDGLKLRMDAIIDVEKTAELDPMLLQRLRAGSAIDVSIGAFVVTQDRSGVLNGKRYEATWHSLDPDHLAILPSTRGACGIADGCGVRAASSLVTLRLPNRSYMEVPMSQLDLEQMTARHAAGKRHSAADQEALDSAHDQLVRAGATCSGAPNLEDLSAFEAPDPYKAGIAQRRAAALNPGEPTRMLRDASGTPDPYATALARRKEMATNVTN